LPSSVAVCPAGISSFFEICTVDESGIPVQDQVRVGARGGGFAIRRGVRATVRLKKAERVKFRVRIEGQPRLRPATTEWALRQLAQETGLRAEMHVDLDVRVPIGAGYGTSAAGTAAALLGVSDAANLPVTFEQLGRLAHVAEVENRTGLGTASALFIGGFVLVTEPGAPGFGKVDRLLFPRNHVLVCGYLEPMLTREVLGRIDLVEKVNPIARTIMNRIRANPSLKIFLNGTGEFGRRTGFSDAEVMRLRSVMISSGAVGAAQNMIGKAVHAVVEESGVAKVTKAVKKAFPRSIVFSSSLDESGVRILG